MVNFDEVIQESKKRRRRTMIFFCIAAIAVLVTVVALMYRGLAFSKNMKTLECSYKVHQHTEECYDADGDLACGKADYVIHSHTYDCYDYDGNLVCKLPEIAEHVHVPECYVSAEPACGMETGEIHEHTDACYSGEDKIMECSMQEHVHDETCMDENGETVCGIEEHTHTDACYRTEKELICTIGTGPHVHTDKCYVSEEPLCGLLELHSHTDECYIEKEDGSRELVCTIPVLEEHVHGDGCFVMATEAEAGVDGSTAEAALMEPDGNAGDTQNSEFNSDNETEANPAGGETDSEDSYEPIIGAAPSLDEPSAEDPAAEGDVPMPIAAGDDMLSSNLEDFLSNVTITDANGNPVDKGGNIYVGESYTVTMVFQEEKGGLQFQPDSNGKLTYQLPDNFNCQAQGPIELKVGDEVVGSYTIDENGFLTVEFVKDKEGKYAFDKYQDTAITITLDTQAQPSTSGGGNNFGGKLDDLEWNVTGDPELSADKEFVGYNVKDDVISYSVDVTPSHGDMHKPHFTDSMDHKTEFAGIDKVTITDAQGHVTELSAKDYTVQVTDDGFELVVNHEVKNGEKLHVEYHGKVKSSAVNENGDIDYTDDNRVYIYDEANPNVHIEDSTSKSITDYRIHKSGWADKTSAGIPVIGWGVQVSADDLGDVITDTIGDGQEFYTGSRIPTVTFYDENGNEIGSQQLKFGSADATISGDGKTATFQMPDLPDGTEYVILNYYTTYEESSDHIKEFTNTATTNGLSDDCTVRTTANGVDKTVTGTYIGDDGREYIDYQMEAVLPAGPYSSYFYFVDKLRFYDVSGQTYYADNTLTDISVFVTKADGTIDVYHEYTGDGNMENTYSLAYNAYNKDGQEIRKTNGYFYMLFNCDGTSRSKSNLPYDEPVTLTILYSIPTDIAVQGGDGTMQTLKGLLDEGYEVNNKGTVNLDSSSTEMEDDVDYADPDVTKRLKKESEIVKEYTCGMEEGMDHHHTAECGESSYIEYTVMFKNWEGTRPSNSADQIIPDPRGLVITDQFDPDVLEFVEITGLKWDTPKGDDTEAAFTYYGNNPVVENGKIVLDPRDFIMTGGSKKSGNGDYWSGYKYHQLDADGDQKKASLYECMWGRSDTYLDSEGKSHKDGYTLVLTYKMKIKDSVLEGAMSSYITADNTVSLDFGPESGAETYVYTDTNHVEYNTGMMGKNVGDIVGNRVPFTIYLNGERKRLTDGTETIDLKDIMSTNLSLDWDSVKVETASYGRDGQITWTELNYPEDYTKFYDTDETMTDGNGSTYIANVLTIHDLPDATYIRVSYETIVVGIGSVRVTNRAELNGKTVIQDATDTTFDVNNSGGGVGGTTESFTVIKQDATDSSLYLPGAKFDVYLVGFKPGGMDVSPEKFTINDKEYTAYKLGSIETDANGSAEFESQYLIDGRTYLLVETYAPGGYLLPNSPFVFVYAGSANDSEIEGANAQSVYSVLKVDNAPMGGYELPKTGSTGTRRLYAVGGIFLVLGVSILGTKKKGRTQS